MYRKPFTKKRQRICTAICKSNMVLNEEPPEYIVLRQYQGAFILEDTKRLQGVHRIVMTGRKTALISGVLDVLSFDTREVLLETDMGLLMLKGEDLHINRLTLEKGEVDMDGRLDSVVYSENSHLKGEDGFLKKLFR